MGFPIGVIALPGLSTKPMADSAPISPLSPVIWIVLIPVCSATLWASAT